MSDGVQILLFALALVVPIVSVLGLLVVRAQKSGAKGRNRDNVSVSDSMNDISNAID